MEDNILLFILKKGLSAWHRWNFMFVRVIYETVILRVFSYFKLNMIEVMARTLHAGIFEATYVQLGIIKTDHGKKSLCALTFFFVVFPGLI